VKAGWQTKRLAGVTPKIGNGAMPLGGEEAYKETGICLIRSMKVHDWGFKEAKLARINHPGAADYRVAWRGSGSSAHEL
jgi:type I restriction enzyme S subunit